MAYNQIDAYIKRNKTGQHDSIFRQDVPHMSAALDDHAKSQQSVLRSSLTITNVRSLNDSTTEPGMHYGSSLSPTQSGMLSSGFSTEQDRSRMTSESFVEYAKNKVHQLEEDLRLLKVSISNVFHSFCSLPNTKINQELKESIQNGTISALVLFLGRLVERLEMYSLQEENLKELKGLFEDTSSMNCTLIAENKMIKNEINDIVEMCATVPVKEIKKKLVNLLNRTDRGFRQHSSPKTQEVNVKSLNKPTKLKRVRSSQLRSRHPMYEASSRSRTVPEHSGRDLLPKRTRMSEQKHRRPPENMAPDDVIEVSSKDGESDHNNEVYDIKDEEMSANANGQCVISMPDLIMIQGSRKRKRGQYSHYDRDTRWMIGRYASEHGASKSAVHFTRILGHNVSESTVRSMAHQFSKGLLNVDDSDSIKGHVHQDTPVKSQSELSEIEKASEKSESKQDNLVEDIKPDVESTEQVDVGDTDFLPHWTTLMSENGRQKRGRYVHYDEVMRADIGKYAVKHGVAQASRHFTEEIGRKVSESTIRGMRDQYQKLQQRGEGDISVLPNSPRGAPTLLGNLDSEVQKWIQNVRMQGGLINTRVVMAAAEGIVLKFARHKLKRFGGDISITKHYARSVLRRMGLVKSKHSKGTDTLPDDFEAIRSHFISRMNIIVSESSVPDSLVINWNHISCHLVPGGNWTKENSVDQNMHVCSLDDRRQISIILAIAKSGHLLPPQIIYHGKSERCLPNSVTFPNGWDVIYSDSQFGNEETMLRYFDRIILPYVTNTRGSLLKTEHTQQAVALFDATETNTSEALYQMLEDNQITPVFVPVCCKERLQPINLGVNDFFKDSIKQQFDEWYTQEVLSMLQQSDNVTGIDLKTSRLKPIHAQWMVKSYMHLERQSEVIQMGFTKAGL